MGLFRKKDAEKSAEVEGEKKKDGKRVAIETLEAIAIALVLALLLRAFVVQAFKIPSGSMEDTLLVGDHILVSKFAYGLQVPTPAWIKVKGVSVPFFETRLVDIWGTIETGDVIVFRYPGDRDKDYIKRVIGAPGDRVEVRNKVIYINGKKFDDPYGVFKGPTSGESKRGDNFGPYLVPEDSVFVMGDNRDRSYDSRFWGPVKISEIKGRAFIIYFSWDGQDDWIRFSRIGKAVE